MPKSRSLALRLLLSLLFAWGLVAQSLVAQAEDEGVGNPLRDEAPYQTSHTVSKVKIETEAQPPQPNPTQLAQAKAFMKFRGRPRPNPVAPTQPQAGPTAPPQSTPPTSGGASNIGLFKNTIASNSAPLSERSSTLEPAVAEAGQNVLYTANWFAALSTDGGTSFSYINPYTKFPFAAGGFCCDQDVIYDASHDLMIWNLMYLPSTNSSIMRVAFTRGANLTAGNWSYLDLSPKDIAGFITSDWFDYPQIALSNNYLYLTANVFRGTVQDATYSGTQIIRIPLGQLAAGTAVTKTDRYAASNLDTITPVQGAGSTMYFGMHSVSSPLTQLVLFSWPETGNISSKTISHATSTALVSVNDYYKCPSPDLTDACTFLDNRILAAWVGKGRIGFMWNDPKGTGGLGTFTVPYIHVVVLDEATRNLASESAIWNSTVAFIYPSAAVNARGDVAGTITWSGGGNYPTGGVWLWDNQTNGGAGLVPLEARFIAASTEGPSDNRFGDYLRSRPSSTNGYEWVGTCFTLLSATNSVEGRYLRFGRQSDEGNPPPTPAPASGPLVYFPLPKPIRLIDTRTVPGTVAKYAGDGALQAGATRPYAVTNLTYQSITIPSEAKAIEGNTQVAAPPGAGFLTVYPVGSAQPVAATMLYNTGQFLANAVTLTVGTGGAINFYTSQTTDILLDVTGYYAPLGTPDPNNGGSTTTGLKYYPLPQPVRLIDTRTAPGTTAKFAGGGPIQAGTSRSYTLSNLSYAGVTIPAQAKALVGNTQVSLPPAAGYLTLYPGNLTQAPTIATMLYNPNQYLANALTLTLAPNGAVNIFSFQTTDVVLDITGYYAPPTTGDPNSFSSGLSYYPLSNPVRLLDTRTPAQAYYNSVGVIGAGGTLTQTYANLTYLGVNIPTSARALVGNVQVAAPATAGFLTAYPGGGTLPTASTLLYNPGQYLANALVVTLGSGGSLSLYSFQTTDVLLDVSGYFA